MALFVLLCLGTAAVMAPASHAGPEQTTIFEDARLLSVPDPERAQLLDELQGLGVQALHVLLPWDEFAPRPSGRRKPRGFDSADPAAYPARAWESLDSLVRGAAARGMDVLLTPNGPAPQWAQSRRARARSWAARPSPREFGRLVQAVAIRYSGTYDAEDGNGVLPAVTFWSFWNEPNLPGWLDPQMAFSRLLGKRIPYSPRLYRRLYVAGERALGRAGHAGDRVLLGELAPLGRAKPRRPYDVIAPAVFLRELFCLDSRMRPFRGAERAARGCHRYHRMRAAGLATHPYVLNFSQNPKRAFGNRTWTSIGSLGRLEKLLDRAAARRRVRRRLPVYITEFGVFTYGVQATSSEPNQPDILERQAAYLNAAEYLAYRDPRVLAYAQYQYADDPPPSEDGSYTGWYTGIRFSNNAPKPAYDAFRLPIHVRCVSPDEVRIWGLVRPIVLGSSTVQIEAGAGGEFAPVGEPVTISNPRGFFEVAIDYPGATSHEWRFSWTSAAGVAYQSRSARPFNAHEQQRCEKNAIAPPLPEADPGPDPSASAR